MSEDNTHSSTQREQWQRRTAYWISHRLQFPFVRISLGHLFFFIALSGTALLGPMVMELQGGLDLSEARRQNALQLLYIFDRFWPAALGGVLVVFLDCVRVSHRFAGPLYRLKLTMKQAAQGKIPDAIRFRKDDYLHAEADAFNEVLDYMRVRENDVATLRNEVTSLKERIAELESTPVPDITVADTTVPDCTVPNGTVELEAEIAPVAEETVVEETVEVKERVRVPFQ